MVNAAPNNALAEASSSTVPSDKVALTNCFLGLRVEYTGIFGKEAADALIDQEYYCSFEAAILGAYWGKEMLLAEHEGHGQGFDHYCEWLDKRGYHGTDCGIRTT
jgi:hypothetical protein